MGKTIAELHAMLQLHEKGIPKKAETRAMLATWEGKIQKGKKKPQRAKGNDKRKNKLAYAPKPKISLPPKRDNSTKDSVYHYCKEGLRGSKTLKHGALSLYVGNGMRVAIKAIKSFDLVLPSGLIVILDNCYFAPTITRDVVSISCLVNNSYIHTFMNYVIYVLKDNVFYLNAILRDGIYEIDMHNLYPNVSSMFNVSYKIAKHALDSSYLWLCCLGHTNKKCMEKLQRDGIFQLTYDESLEKCKSCIFRKMVWKPFIHQVERAKDILGLIHTDVSDPFRTVSRVGVSYFITFTNDFSRYGYVISIWKTFGGNTRDLDSIWEENRQEKNLRRTLRDYSRPSYEGYRNTIEVTNGNDLVPLRSDTIRLVQNGCSFHGLRSEDPNQHLKDFLKIVDSIDLNVETRKRTHLLKKEKESRDTTPREHEGLTSEIDDDVGSNESEKEEDNDL
nr:hypothetical protein [Tanacetum cinerariifolium]